MLTIVDPLIRFGAIRDTLSQVLSERQYSSLVILADTHTAEYCYPLLGGSLPGHHLILVPYGEMQKTLETVGDIYRYFGELELDRKALVLILGGGVLSDLGAFAASTYKRGIQFILIPTTLLSMVDACYGGKTGVNWHSAKNQIGTFQFPEEIWIDMEFLKSLPVEEIKSGWGEIYKYSFLSQEIDAPASVAALPDMELVRACLNVKRDIVQTDPYEANQRKLLNFGHTIGHALEAHFMDTDQPLSHGNCVALGIAGAMHLSAALKFCTDDLANQALRWVGQHYGLPEIAPESFEDILVFMRQDKKASNGHINFVLCRSQADLVLDVAVSEDYIIEALHFISRI